MNLVSFCVYGFHYLTMLFFMRLKKFKSIILLGLFIIFSWIIYSVLFQKRFDLSSIDLVKGEQIYNNTCIACHMTGHFGAPKMGNQTEWKARLEKGFELLLNNSLKGLNSMPPKGGNSRLSDEEVKAAVAFIVTKSW